MYSAAIGLMLDEPVFIAPFSEVLSYLYEHPQRSFRSELSAAQCTFLVQYQHLTFVICHTCIYITGPAFSGPAFQPPTARLYEYDMSC